LADETLRNILQSHAQQHPPRHAPSQAVAAHKLRQAETQDRGQAAD